MLESIQQSCKQYLKLTLSFAASSEPCEWENLSAQFVSLHFLFIRGIGAGSEMLLTDRHKPDQQPRAIPHFQPSRKIPLLEQLLDKRKQAEFEPLFLETMSQAEAASKLQPGAAMETFYAMVSLIAGYMNRLGLTEAMSKKFNLHQAFSLEQYASWQDTTDSLLRLAVQCLEKAEHEQDDQTSEVVRCIHAYVQTHLAGDLSLTQLADVVYLTPSYISRLYKQMTNQNLMTYISEARLAKAKHLLVHSQLKIQEIGAQVGYDSPPYFTRFFKKSTRLTPQEYRELHMNRQQDEEG